MADAEISIMAEVCYRDPRTALDWLAAAFGCQTRLLVAGDDGALSFATAGWGAEAFAVIPESPPGLSSPQATGGVNTQRLHVTLADGLAAHCETARAAGARIVVEPTTAFFGQFYTAADLEGHLWTFRQSSAANGPPPQGWSVTRPDPQGRNP